jgi:hypothetical protein
MLLAVLRCCVPLDSAYYIPSYVTCTIVEHRDTSLDCGLPWPFLDVLMRSATTLAWCLPSGILVVSGEHGCQVRVV